MGASSNAAWCAIDDEVVFLSALGAARFPNAVLASEGWERLRPGDDVVLGSFVVRGSGVDWKVVRWWDPVVVPITVRASDVQVDLLRPANMLCDSPRLGLERALGEVSEEDVIAAAAGMLGAGGGLTPEGDDRLVGTVAAFRHVSGSLGCARATDLLDGVADEILAMAARSTSSLSFTLLRHAFSGEVAEPVAALLRAVTGYGDLTSAAERCLAIGSSSGKALVSGVLSGARAACESAS